MTGDNPLLVVLMLVLMAVMVREFYTAQKIAQLRIDNDDLERKLLRIRKEAVETVEAIDMEREHCDA